MSVIAKKAGQLDGVIHRAKDPGRWGWGVVLGRLLLGYLYEHPDVVEGIDAIIPVPAYRQPGHISDDHASRLISQAADQDMTGFPFVLEPPLIVLKQPVPKMRMTSGFAERQQVGAEIYNALHVPDPSRVVGKQITAFDDVFTTGTTLNAVARRLREAGATAVYGLALARAQWR